MNQPTPVVGDADIERLITRDFRYEDVAAARVILASYGSKEWHRESARVWAACLKMAAGSVERLRQAVAVADSDYRDVLASAEYPSYIRKVSPSEKDPLKKRQAIDDDWRQYRDWFQKA